MSSPASERESSGAWTAHRACPSPRAISTNHWRHLSRASKTGSLSSGASAGVRPQQAHTCSDGRWGHQLGQGIRAGHRTTSHQGRKAGTLTTLLLSPHLLHSQCLLGLVTITCGFCAPNQTASFLRASTGSCTPVASTAPGQWCEN